MEIPGISVERFSLGGVQGVCEEILIIGIRNWGLGFGIYHYLCSLVEKTVQGDPGLFTSLTDIE